MSEKINPGIRTTGRINRRNMLKMAAGTGAAGVAAMALGSCASVGGSAKPAATKGRINHSVAYWCFSQYWDLEKTCQITKQLGGKSIELVGPKDFPTLKKYGLTCALAPNGTPDPPFVKGFNNPEHHDMIIAATRKTIDACAEYNFPSVIAFTGFREDIPDDVGAENCVAGLKKIIGYAEKKKVNICLEILNSRVAVEMQGHPGYQGDHTDYCIDIIRKVGSQRMKLLFDIYHVQIMDGDVISRIRQYSDYIGHYHTAGNPGRGELDDKQEINYPPIMKEIVKTGYKGYVGHEFVPTRDPLEGLTEAIALCDV
ncbi:MAG: hydroxypyruvate isomerase family protein [Planctomycetota bacterium]|jgi:hydroxypyruvate isomerase